MLKNLSGNLHLTLGALMLLKLPECREWLTSKAAFIQGGDLVMGAELVEVPRDSIFFSFENIRELPDMSLKELLKSQFGGTYVTSYELVKAYCNDSEQFTSFSRQAWYPFFRTIRNSIAHDFHFELPLKSSKRGRVVDNLVESNWNGRSITSNLEGQLIPISFLGWNGMWEMIIELQSFVDRALT